MARGARITRRSAMWPAQAFPRALGSSAARLRKPLVNQNLLYLVFTCLINTKHSGSARALQAVFHAQEGGAKRAGKTVSCGAPAGLCNDNPPLIHTSVHRSRRRRTVVRRCRFATQRFMLQRTRNDTTSRRRKRARYESAAATKSRQHIVADKRNPTSICAIVDGFYTGARRTKGIHGKCLKRRHLIAHGMLLAALMRPSASLCDVLHSTRVEAR